MFQKINPKQSFPKLEEEILAYWQDEQIFQQSVEQNRHKEQFTFYDGPPFATGLPHYGHILAGTIKDAVPRYWTMKGYYVPRKFGWDCHGLPIENIVEKQLEAKTKKDIEETIGVHTFNETCRSVVLKYTNDWEKIVARMGRWVDFKNDYKTMDPEYMESVWWVFKELWSKKLIYNGHKSMHICPRCETPLSNFEVGQGYKDITDVSVYAKFKLIQDPSTGSGSEEKASGGKENIEYMLAWTTTPWTLPGNMYLAINQEIEYVRVITEEGRFICAKNLAEALFDTELSQLVTEPVDINAYLGTSYEPLFPYFADNHTFKVVEGDFVTDDSGTGIVHIAPAFGDDDMKMLQEGDSIIQHVLMNGEFTPEVTDFAGQLVKPADDHMKTDRKIVEKLAELGKLFKKQNYKHSYPHCWRCDTPLLNYATGSWYVRVTELRDKMVANNQKVHWVPGYIKSGRFGKWLENARDWAVSRNRFWGTPLPIWKAEDHEDYLCIGSVAELEKFSGEKVDDLHKHFMDEVTIDLNCDFVIARHGQYHGNLENTLNSAIDGVTPLNEVGKQQAKQLGEDMKGKGIDVIYSSPLQRCRETAEIVAETLGCEVIYDARIREQDFGTLKTEEELKAYVKTRGGIMHARPEGGESLSDCKVRLGAFIHDVAKQHASEKIMVLSHCGVMAVFGMMMGDFVEKNANTIIEDNYLTDPYLPNCGYKEFTYKRTFKRIPEVFDCWFESGSMPYAQQHHPFRTAPKVKNTYVIARHGQAEHNVKGVLATNPDLYIDACALTDVGVEGVAESRESYTGHVDMIYASDYLRTRETAEVWNEKWGHDITFDVRLREAFQGDADGMSIDAFLEKYPKKTRLTEHPFGGETYTDILARLTSFVDEMEAQHEGKTILLVTHGSPSRVLYKYLNSQSIIEDSDFLQPAQYHVVSPESQKSFADRFPANFIAEGQDQTRGWFYTLTVLGTALFDRPAFENVVVNGIVLAEDGKKMSKRLKNYPDPNHVFDSYGADSMRLYLLGSPVVRGDDFRFTERGVEQVMKGFMLPLWNAFSFFVTYANIDGFAPDENFDYQSLTSSLDTWVLARLHETIKQVDTSMQEYELKFAVENVMKFTDDLTNWYIRRSRRRFWKSENDGDKMQAYQTLWYVLTEFTKVLAPFAPYISDYIYRLLTDAESSVHLQDFPAYTQQFIDQADTERVAIVQKIVALGHKIRASENLKVRQPLALMEYSASITFTAEEIGVIQEELNVKSVMRAENPESLATKLVKPNARVLGPRFGKKVQDVIREAKAGNYTELGDGNIEVLGEVLTSAEIEIVYQSKDDRPVTAEGVLVVSLDIDLTEELILEGKARDFVRLVQDLRKQADFHVADRIEITVSGEYEIFMNQFTDYIQNETLANSITSTLDSADIEHTDDNGEVKVRKV